MKLITMSLVAAMALSTAAMAEISNLKVSGDAKLLYSTTESATNDLFSQAASIADTAFTLKATADLSKTLKAGVTASHVSTLGLENNLVGGTFSGSHPGTGVEDFTVTTEMWIAADMGKTTAKIGRQELDTPLAFSETWSVVPNTFNALTLSNKSFENTTIVAGWIGTGNGGLPLATDGQFTAFGTAGAYAVGAVYDNEKSKTKAQLWAYNALQLADALWLEYEQGMSDLTLGLQYTTLDLNSGVSSDAAAVKVGYAKDALSASVAYSQVGKDAGAGYNFATTTAGAQSKLYTEAWWWYGQVTLADTTAMNVTLEYDLTDSFNAAVFHTMTESTAGASDLTETTVALTKTYDDVEASLVYIMADISGIDQGDTVQLYVTAEF